MSFEYVNPLLEKLSKSTEEARREYQSLSPVGRAAYEPDAPSLLRDWLSLTVTFQLQAPWYSKDDLPFHVLDNPVHRDHVFGAPFMSASSWKGLLRWAARMQSGLLAHLEANNNELHDWKDSAEVIHLFGNERDRTEHFQRGSLAFRPTWFDKFDKIGFEVINPHDRSRRAGTKPILYEVVPPGAVGSLRLLYAPAPGEPTSKGVSRLNAMLLLLDAVEALLTEYGFSAKRTSGWGVASITTASLRWHEGSQDGKLNDIREAVKRLFGGTE